MQTYWNQENVLQDIQNLAAPHGPNNRIVPLIGIAAVTILADGNPEWPAPPDQVLLDRFQVKPAKQGRKYHPHGLWIEATRGCYLEMVFKDMNHLRDVFSRLYEQQVGWAVPVMVLTSPEALWPDERIVEVWANKKNLNGHDLICFTEMNRGPVFEMPGSATVNDQFFQYLCLEKQ